MIVVGLMSGTSADGVDAAAAEIGSERPRPAVRLLAHTHHAYADALRRLILAAGEGESLSAADLARMRTRIGEAHAEAARTCIAAARLEPGRVDAVATHGQTVAHLPAEGVTLQLVDAARIAEALRVPVVADFRSADMAAGGEGAPLVPFADWVVFADAARSRAVQNVGGIANVTILPRGGGRDDVVAFDTGPGNMVVDALVARATGGARRYDEDGAMAARGRVRDDLVARAMAHEYFDRRPPKSTGREEFGAGFVDAFADAGAGLAPEDLVASATALTARSIADAYRRFAPPLDDVIVAGGGARNATLLVMLRAALAPAAVRTSADVGIPVEAREALAFAVLGAFALAGEPNTLPRTTGARRAVVAGAVYRP